MASVGFFRVGLEGVDDVREKTGLPCSPDVVKDRSTFVRKRFCWVYLTEYGARETGLFNNRSGVKVKVPPLSLNHFVKHKWSIETTNYWFPWKEDRVTHAELVYYLDEDAVYEAWEAAGFPTEWNPSES